MKTKIKTTKRTNMDMKRLMLTHSPKGKYDHSPQRPNLARQVQEHKSEATTAGTLRVRAEGRREVQKKGHDYYCIKPNAKENRNP